METPEDTAIALYEALNRHDLDAAEGWWHEDVVEDITTVGEFEGKPAVRAHFAQMFGAAPDYALEIVSIITDETTAVVQWRATGTFNGGAFMGILATGRTIALRGVDVLEIRDGKVQRSTVYYDGLAFARQFGLLPSEGSVQDRALLAGFNARTRALGFLRRP